MKTTIQRLTEHLIDQARTIADESERIGDAGGIAVAEAVIHLRDAQRCLRVAQDALRLAIAQQGDGRGIGGDFSP